VIKIAHTELVSRGLFETPLKLREREAACSCGCEGNRVDTSDRESSRVQALGLGASPSDCRLPCNLLRSLSTSYWSCAYINASTVSPFQRMLCGSSMEPSVARRVAFCETYLGPPFTPLKFRRNYAWNASSLASGTWLRVVLICITSHLILHC
jgi:hypothetical protein